MQERSLSQNMLHQNNRSYGWVVVVACAVMLGITYGTLYRYSVFFKPLA